VGKVQRRVALCAYGVGEDGQRELIDFLLVRSESEENWRSLLEELWRRGLHGTKLRLITTDGNPGLIAALELV
jgi:transposase-like protein